MFKYSDNPKEIEVARQGCKELLNSFYAEVSDYIPLSQYKAAEKDFEILSQTDRLGFGILY